MKRGAVTGARRAAALHAVFHEALPADLFSVRARVLLGQAAKRDAASYLSGLLIGTDVRIGLTEPAAAKVSIMGDPTPVIFVTSTKR